MKPAPIIVDIHNDCFPGGSTCAGWASGRVGAYGSSSATIRPKGSEEGVPQPPEGTPHIKGQLLLSRLDYLAKLEGSEAIQRVLQALPDLDREQLRGVVRDEWYPLASLIRLDRVIADVLFPGDPEVFERLGAASASHRTEWLGAHARLVSVHGFLQRVAEEHRRFHSFGRAAYRRVAFNTGEIAFSEYPEIDAIYCLSARGFFRSAVELLTGEPATVDELHCQCRGDAECAFRVSWTRSLA